MRNQQKLSEIDDLNIIYSMKKGPKINASAALVFR